MDKLTEKCAEYEISRIKRNNDMRKGLGKGPTFAYERRGCYNCDGFNTSCPDYVSPLGEFRKFYVEPSSKKEISENIEMEHF